jgi:hypothetical protein
MKKAAALGLFGTVIDGRAVLERYWIPSSTASDASPFAPTAAAFQRKRRGGPGAPIRVGTLRHSADRGFRRGNDQDPGARNLLSWPEWLVSLSQSAW